MLENTSFKTYRSIKNVHHKMFCRSIQFILNRFGVLHGLNDPLVSFVKGKDNLIL